MTIELFILGAYFLFLLSLMYLANNIGYYANHTEQFVKTIGYNLRDLPRVDYTEEDSDLSESTASEEENLSLRNRRDKNPVSRIISEILD